MAQTLSFYPPNLFGPHFLQRPVLLLELPMVDAKESSLLQARLAVSVKTQAHLMKPPNTNLGHNPITLKRLGHENRQIARIVDNSRLRWVPGFQTISLC